MLLKKTLTSICAAAVLAATTVVPCIGASAADLPTPEPDENGVYCQAGIVWMVMDQWDHRKDITLEPTDEKETITLDGTYKDVNITGNGEYTVEMSGYHIENDWIDAGAQMGYLGVELTLDFDEYFDADTYEGVTFEVTKAVIDGTEYTFTNNVNEDGEHEQVIEPPEISADGQRMIKIKNGYGNLPEFCTPALNNDVWTTIDPLTITFKVSGLPTDKIEGYADEVIEKVYGNGVMTEETEESSAEEASSTVEESSAAESASDSSKADTAAASTADDSSSSDSEESSNTGLIIGIVCAAVVVIAVVAVVIKKKS